MISKPEQLSLSGFEVIPTVARDKTHSQPSPQSLRLPKAQELRWHNYDLKQRGVINRWLNYLESEKKRGREGFFLQEILPEELLILVRLYFFPQPPDNPNGKWLTQEEVVGARNIGDFKTHITGAIGRIYRRQIIGSLAMEILKPGHFLYYNLVESNKITVTDVLECKPEEFIRICGSRNIFNKLIALIHKQSPDWDPPKLIFPPEDNPSSSAKILLNR